LEAIQALLEQGRSASQIAGELAAQSGWKKRIVYELVNEQKREE
jgi:hypothetical protein